MPAIESTFLSLDFIYVPTGDVDSTVRHYVEVHGAAVRWKVSFRAAGGQRYAVYELVRPEPPPTSMACSTSRNS